MLWPFVLPIQITFGILGSIFIAAFIIAWKLGWRRQRVLGWSAILLILAFLPSCSAIKFVLDQYRFGIFEHANFQSVDDFRIERYLPEPATEITLEKSFQGFLAKFQISKSALDDWFDQYWKQYGEHAAFPRSKPNETDIEKTDDNSEWIELQFGDLGWPLLNSTTVYEGPRAANGAGFTIWYSESTATAYQQGGYW